MLTNISCKTILLMRPVQFIKLMVIIMELIVHSKLFAEIVHPEKDASNNLNTLYIPLKNMESSMEKMI